MGGYLSSPTQAGVSNVRDAHDFQWVEEQVNKDKVVIFSKTTCPYCTTAKKIMDDIGQPYQSYELNHMDNGRNIQDVLCKLTGARTVPRVFIRGESIGGCDDVKSLHETGKLIQLVMDERTDAVL